MGLHVDLGEHTDTLKSFVQQREDFRSMSEVIRYAVGRFFKQEPIDNRKQKALQEVLSRKFAVPDNYVLPSSFYSTLFILAKAAAHKSAKDTWGVVYISGVDRTNNQVFVEVTDETKLLLIQRYGSEAQEIQANGPA